MTMYPPMNCNHSVVVANGIQRDLARNGLVEQALKLGVKYILFVDDDTAPPPNAIQKLMYELDNSDDDVAVCAGVYTTKSDPPQPVILMEEGTGPFWHWRVGDVFPCFAIGTGCMMIRASVFEKLPKPWFVDVNHPDQARELGLMPENDDGRYGSIDRFQMTDDVYFCRKLREHGFKVLAHGGVLCRHYDENGRWYDLPPDCYPIKGSNRYAVVSTDTPEILMLKERYPWPEHRPNVELAEFPVTGWSTEDTEAALKKSIPSGAKVVVELGTFLGVGAKQMAEIAPEATVICIDHWMGSEEHRSDPEMSTVLPKLYRGFVANVWDQRHRFVPMKTTTQAGLRELAELGIKPDVIYVDASHKYDEVRADIRLARKLFPDAVLCGDDWNWAEVRLAVKAELGEEAAEDNGRCWWVKELVTA